MSTSDHPHTGAGPSGQGSWRRRERPLRLERRLAFTDYEATQDFLAHAAALSERTGVYPDLSFGRTYVNLTLFAEEAGGALTPELTSFAQDVDDLVRSSAAAPPENQQ